jgi:hypothetical protein
MSELTDKFRLIITVRVRTEYKQFALHQVSNMVMVTPTTEYLKLSKWFNANVDSISRFWHNIDVGNTAETLTISTLKVK